MILSNPLCPLGTANKINQLPSPCYVPTLAPLAPVGIAQITFLGCTDQIIHIRMNCSHIYTFATAISVCLGI